MLRGSLGSQTISHLTMLRPLGSGSYGVVYEAIDSRTGSSVAVKELDEPSPAAIARFKQEFRVLADYRHPNLVGLKELIEHQGRWLIVMELVPGTDFSRYVRAADNDNGYDEGRLRGALLGMAEGLRALHAYGVLHRDLKPSNVRVRPDGRAVLLDFGLATSFSPGAQSMHSVPLGTVAYMAPEQAAARELTPAADLYALGVCLFQGLTGRLPFDGHEVLQMLLDKQQKPAQRASALASVPPDLDALCSALLATDPEQRPSADDVVSMLRKGRRAEAPRAKAGKRRDSFVGRDAELALLERALARSQEGELRIVLIEGESGVGKSEVAQEFVRRSLQVAPQLIVLRGRCYENEQVSYKVFDGCVDELARVLLQLPPEQCDALMPPASGLLGQLFPVLRQIRAVAWARDDRTTADPTARRIEAFTAFATLLANLGAARPLALVIDDLQWADAESFRLLSALMDHRPSIPLLLVATVRPRSELEQDVLAQVEPLRASQQAEVLPILGLPRAQARALAAPLLGPDAPERTLDMVTDESHGHPLFMIELVEYARRHNYGPHLNITLEAALRARIEGLEQAERALLEVVALAARPYPVNVFAHVLGVKDVEEPTRTLLAAKLLRERKGHELGCYHDRIRHAATDLIARARLRILHGKLAAALASTGSIDAAEQARHWDLAGEPEQALTAYERAMKHAIDTLAFRSAAQLAARALELVGDDRGARALALMVQRAHALSCAGYAADAAELYERAAEHAEGDARLRLRASAAGALLVSSNGARGLALAREVMRELGLRVPATLFGILLRYLWDTFVLRLRLRRVDTEGSRETRPASRERLVLDLTGELLMGVATVHPMLLPATISQQARIALRVGSRSELACVYAGLGWIAAVTRSLAAAEPLFQMSRRLIKGSEDFLALATQAYSEGSGRLAAFDPEGARDCLERASAICQQHLPNRPFLLSSVRYHLGIMWFGLLDFGRLARESGGWIREARERNDVQAVALLVGHGNGFVRHLIRDDPAAAHAELDEVMRPLPKTPLAFAHVGYAVAKTMTFGYQGDGLGALRFLDAFEAEHRETFLLRSNMGRELFVMMRAYAMAQAAPGHELDGPLKRQRQKVLRALRRRRSTRARGLYLIFTAEDAVREGRRDQALKLARAGRALLDVRNGPSSYGAFVGLLEGGASGRAQYDAALENSRKNGFKCPERALRMGVASIPTLLREGPEQRLPALLAERYQIVGQLGGGFADVVSALDTRSGRMVALKELVPGGRTPLERFKQQYRLIAGLHHPNLVQVESLFESHGRWYISMELVQGQPLLAYVREGGECDLARVRASFAGLARALRTLHASELVHSGVEPRNVVVTPEGRTVLVEFGSLARIGDSRERFGVGSAVYAAPEQLRGEQPDPSADVYALGVCLYEALAGRHPFEGIQAQHLLQHKEHMTIAPTSVGQLGPLGSLCERMLAVVPSVRPGLDEVLYVLEYASEALQTSVRGLPPESRRDAAFVGREVEIGVLAAASERSCDEGLIIVLVEGESGVGKSAVSREFARRSEERTPALWILRGRCYEAEQIACKAFDLAVDQLAARLRALPNPVCEELMPPRAALLGQLFPVLNSVSAIARAPKKGLPADPAARKAAGRACFVALLENLCKQTELLLIIDDLQWADMDSFDLLDELLAHAGSLPYLLIANLRPSEETAPEVRERLDKLRRTGRTIALPLAPLPETEARTLANALLGSTSAAAQDIARESAGHPLFLRELVEHERLGLGLHASRRTLDAALRARIERLHPDARQLLSLVALTDKPYGIHVYAHALNLTEIPREVLITLLRQDMLRRRADDTLGTAHDHVRRVARSLLVASERTVSARALAEALRLEPRVDPAERAGLWEQAGEREQAIAAYAEAGERALEALAFMPADQHFARALALLGDVRDERRRRLLAARGTALARAGHAAEAARVYGQAAQIADGEQLVRLRIQEARHLIQSGQVALGIEAATALLRKLGIAVPRGERAALARIAWERARVRLRGSSLSRRAVSSEEQLRLDALHALAAPLSLTNYLVGFTVMAQYLRHALAAGESDHAARALAYEGLWRTLRTPEREATALFERARALADESGDPAVQAQVLQLRGLSCLARTEYAPAIKHFTQAHELVNTRCPGEPWLLTTSRMHLGFAWWASGNLCALRDHAGGWLAQARARDDRCAIAALAGYGGASLRHLFDDDLAATRAELDAVMLGWPDQHFTLIHFGVMAAKHALLNVAPAGPHLLRELQEFEGARWGRVYLLRTPAVQGARLAGRCGVLLRALEVERISSTQLASLRGELHALQRVRAGIALAAGPWFEALLDAVEGRRDRARASFQRIAEERPLTALYGGYGAEYAIGLLDGGASGEARREYVVAEHRREGWREPRTGLLLRAPAIDLLERLVARG